MIRNYQLDFKKGRVKRIKNMQEKEIKEEEITKEEVEEVLEPKTEEEAER